MSELTIFFMEGCPYCIRAEKALQELTAGSEAYASGPVQWIDENKEAELASACDYYYVPSVFSGKTKLYEAKPGDSYEIIRDELEKALQSALA